MSEDWDIDAYRTSFESNDHWELRKSFMLAHKDKFSEDRIVCLAQAFINIELLGCRYPEETMKTVAELAKGVVEPYREKKRNSIKRTFVPASDAAIAKVKGINKFDMLEKKKNKKKKKIKKHGINKIKVLKKKKKEKKKRFKKETQLHVGNMTNVDQELKINTISSNNPCVTTVDQSSAELENSEFQIQKLSGPFANFVLFLYEEHPVTLLQVNATMNNCKIKFQYHYNDGKNTCSVHLNDNYLLARIIANKGKNGRILAATEALKLLQSLCYTVKSKTKIFSDNTIDYSSFIKTCCKEQYNKAISEASVGEKIMKLMGWTGGGLGSSQQGIVEPINLDFHFQRRGFGFENKMNLFEFKQKAKNFIMAWLEQKTHQDLVFTTQFTKEERSVLHKIAQSLSLRSKSYGKKNGRHLVISKKINPWEIVEELKKKNSSSDKYELLIP